MRVPSHACRWTASVRGAMLLVALSATTGCATLRTTLGSYDTAPNGISRPQQQLRETLVSGDYAAALRWREDDALLCALTVGATSYYAAQYAQSGAVLDTAALLADDRITASLSRDALALVTNDMARPYQPRRTERLFIPYYAMLSYARLGAWEDAAVEARRLSLLLAQYAEDRDRDERAVHAALHHLAGATFERAGNRGEAEVAYRNAHALVPSLPDSLSRPDSASEGDMLILVERGFVAHRTNETIRIHLGEEDRESLRDATSRRRTADRIASRAVEWGKSGADGSSSVLGALWMASFRGRRGRDDDDDDEHSLPIAFAMLRRAPLPHGTVRLADDDSSSPIRLDATVDDASAADERREHVGVASRAIARAATKYAVTKTVRDKKGEVAGTLAELGASLLERADVRSWHLLPQTITLVRVRLPSGQRSVRLQVGSGTDAGSVDLGVLTIVPGTVTLVPVRLWRDPPARATTFADRPVVSPGGCGALACP